MPPSAHPADALLAQVEKDLESALKSLRAAHVALGGLGEEEALPLAGAATEGALQLEDVVHLVKSLRRQLTRAPPRR